MSSTACQKTNAQHVAEFHTAIGSAFPECPRVPHAAGLALRLTLLREEMQEVEAEFETLRSKLSSPETADLAPLAHELADLLYVTYGALGSLGVDADAVFAEVHRANLGKVAGPRREDGKQLKPAGWRKADVAGVIAALVGDHP